ncbi:MAG TPA: N-acetylmuramoyl-L-alanine amidase, partial [Methylomirabilota bacterium]|nr:N-acetylmuramoyl-L-alanine amidase [Methylomirabilota bacterium]
TSGLEHGHSGRHLGLPGELGAHDIRLRDPRDGHLLDMNNSADRARMDTYIEHAARAGATGIGVGKGQDYMGPHGIHVGGGPGAETVWGAGGASANAPQWARDAYTRGRGSAISPQQVAKEVESLQSTGGGGGVATGDGPISRANIRSMLDKHVTDAGLVGYVPKDGAQYGIKTGTKEEWTHFFTELADRESSRKPRTSNYVDPGGSFGLLQISPLDIGRHTNLKGKGSTEEELYDPDTNLRVGVHMAANGIKNAESIKSGMGPSWGPIKNTNWAPRPMSSGGGERGTAGSADDIEQPVPMYGSENLPKGFPGTSPISEEEISRNVPPTKITPEKKEKEFTSSLAIKDMTKEAGFGTQFGKMDKVEGMVIHHTGPISSVEGVIATFKERNFPAHYIIDRQGNVIRTIPEGYQGQHVEPTDKENRNYVAKGAPPGKSNANLKGVEIMAKNDADTLPVQRAAAAKLVGEDARKEGYDPKTSTWGHGELNPGHKEADEGMSTVSRIRSGELSTEASSSGTVIKGEIVGQHAPGGKDTGSITLPGTKPGEESRTFSFISGGGGRGAAPEIEYEIGETMQGGILGQRQVLTEKGQPHDTARDPAYPGAPRSELRFHKDISQGDHTDGCIGILGDHKVYADFQRRLLYVMEKNGPGKTTFRFGSKEAQEVMERMDAKPDKEPPIKDSQVQSASEQALKYSNLPGTKGWTFEPKEGTERPSVAGARDADTEEQQLTEWQMRGGDFGARAREQRGVFKMPEGAIPSMETITPKQGITPTPDESAKPISLREWFGFKSPKNPDEVSPERLREYGWGQHERPGLPEQAPPEYDYSYGNVRRYGVGRNQILAPPSGRKIEEDIRDAEDIEKDQQEENVKKDDKEEKAKQDEQRDSEKPASKEVEKVKSPRHDPESESKGANDDGYGSQHRNSGDYTGTTDHDPDLDS